MKTAICVSAILISILILSCSNSEDLSSEDVFGGKYVGYISYSDSENEIQNPEGSAFVSQNGEYWNFSFSNEIPEIDSVKFLISSDGEVMMNEGATETHLIRITSETLQIVYDEIGQSWTIHGFRP